MNANTTYYVRTIGADINEGFRTSLQNLSKDALTTSKKTLNEKRISFWMVDEEVVEHLLKSADYRRGKHYEIYVEVKGAPEIVIKWAKNLIKKFKKDIIRANTLTKEQKLDKFRELKRKIR